ncbi:hypothetical protein NUW54_g1374 [Trametes sanguinea]|uniref:Uncharacterized protein n=1 Tax=Trametes sanguinea TaxID=158606 RepID=A0ACC1Q8F1_9APHY|nr:hypothetical protein NUW54_g1374 [Trametes sanguinea]
MGRAADYHREPRAYHYARGSGTGRSERGRGRRNQPGGRALSERGRNRRGRQTHRGNRAGRSRPEEDLPIENLSTGEPPSAILPFLLGELFAELRAAGAEGDEAQTGSGEPEETVPEEDSQPAQTEAPSGAENPMEVDYGSDFEDALRIGVVTVSRLPYSRPGGRM